MVYPGNSEKVTLIFKEKMKINFIFCFNCLTIKILVDKYFFILSIKHQKPERDRAERMMICLDKYYQKPGWLSTNTWVEHEQLRNKY